MRAGKFKYRSLIVATLFVVVLVLVLTRGPYLIDSSQSAAFNRNKGKVFDRSVTVSARGGYLRVLNHPVLDPSKDRDFLLVSWFSLRRIPEQGERFILVSKYEADSDSRQGYSIALDGDKGFVRPSIYWRDEKGRGGWFEFASLDIQPEQWLMLAVSFRQSRYLGLHLVSPTESGQHIEPVLLGGYDLSGQNLPLNSSDLLYGASRTRFPGLLGPIAIFAPDDLSSVLSRTLKELGARPLELPASLKGENVLWLHDTREDLSKFRHKIESVQLRRGSN